MTVRDFADQPFAAWRAPAQPRPIGRGAGFVDEDQMLGIKLGLMIGPLGPCGRNVRPVLLSGAQAFF